MSEFKYGDIVKVRDNERGKWRGNFFYLGRHKSGGHWTMGENEDESNYAGFPLRWNEARMAPVQKIKVKKYKR